MQIWLDTCDREFILTASRLGLVYGVTTNPSILAGMQENPDKIIAGLLEIQAGPVAVQVTVSHSDEMIKQALALHSFSDRIVVKIPVIQEGLIAMKELVQKGVSIMATAIFQPNQAILAAIVGVDYIAPYVCRMFDEGFDAYASLQLMVSIYKSHHFKTKILAAALRTADQITACASMGISAATLKEPLFSQFVANDPSTLKALRLFSDEWQACDLREKSIFFQLESSLPHPFGHCL